VYTALSLLVEIDSYERVSALVNATMCFCLLDFSVVAITCIDTVILVLDSWFDLLLLYSKLVQNLLIISLLKVPMSISMSNINLYSLVRE